MLQIVSGSSVYVKIWINGSFSFWFSCQALALTPYIQLRQAFAAASKTAHTQSVCFYDHTFKRAFTEAKR